MVTIREFVVEDIAAVLQIEHVAHPAGHWRAEDYQWLVRQEGGIVLVAELADRVVAFIAARALGPEAEMLNLAVTKEHRREGIARTLVRELHRRLQAGGVQRVYLEVRPSNISAQRLYWSLGYAECGRRHKYYTSNGEDALVLEFRLQPVSQPDSHSD